jgi:hypothetical protein
MHHKTFFVPVSLLLIAVLPVVAQAATQANAAITAKVRVYQEAKITLYPGEYCYGSKNPAAIDTSSNGWGIFSISKRENMPVTDDISGSYNEYVIPAGVPISVMLKWEAEKNGVKASCGPIGSTFFPQAGKNYDVTIGVSGNCHVQIRELLETSPGKASAIQTPSSYSFACGNN